MVPLFTRPKQDDIKQHNVGLLALSSISAIANVRRAWCHELIHGGEYFHHGGYVRTQSKLLSMHLAILFKRNSIDELPSIGREVMASAIRHNAVVQIALLICLDET